MHAWIKLACVVLAWTILPVSVASAGRDRPVHPVQVSTRTSNTSFTSAHPAPRPATAALTSFTVAPATKPPAPRSYVVQPGDTLSAIAARFGVRGGWPALYAANRSVIGPDPGAISAGTRLTIPSSAPPPPSGSAPGQPAPGQPASGQPAPGQPAPGQANPKPTGPAPSSAPSAP